MNHTYVDHERQMNGGGFLQSEVGEISLPSLRSRHNHSTLTILA
jgi:hypothetical protein